MVETPRGLGLLGVLGIVLATAWGSAAHAQEVEGWLRWRGPEQTGSSREQGLPEDLDPAGENALWSHELAGRGSAVVTGERVYTMGYRGQGAKLQEILTCLELTTGKLLWEHGFSDFLSDIIYERYSIGAPTIDAQTGNVYALSSPGLLVAFSADGTPLWERSLLEELGRLTFPNGRTGSPAIDGPLVVVNAISTSWGALGPGRNRFFAFDKHTGALVWTSTPGTPPKDSSFSTPVFAWRDGRRVFYAGTGCGHVVCVDMASGAPVWRYRISAGGVNASVLVAGNRLVAIHGKENLDTTSSGRMLALDLRGEVGVDGVLSPEAELWRNDLLMFTSSPTLVGERIYQVTATGDLCAVDLETGRVLWRKRLADEQLHASPLAADGKLYVPLWGGEIFVLRPGEEDAEVLSKVELAGSCLGSPTVWRGHLLVHTTEKLYCFKRPEAAPAAEAAVEIAGPAEPGTSLCLLPGDFALRPGEEVQLRLCQVGPDGLVELDLDGASFEVVGAAPRAPAPDVRVNAGGLLRAGGSASAGAGGVRIVLGERSAECRVRVLPAQVALDFEDTALNQQAPDGTAYAHPPGAWIGGRLKWQVRKLDGSNVLTKTLDRVLFQRTMTFLGSVDQRGYTIEADVRSDGTRRLQSNVGVICQRYIIMLEGNWQELQVVSNHDRVKLGVPFAWKPRTWYRIRARVDTTADGGVVVRASAWPRDEEPPEGWLLELPLDLGHDHGAPGLFGFSPQSRYAVQIDNVAVYPSDTNTGDE